MELAAQTWFYWLQGIGLALGIVAVVISICTLRKQIVAERRLIRNLAMNRTIVAQIEALEASISRGNDSHDIENTQLHLKALRALLDQQIASLPGDDRNRILAPMRQPSQVGQARYIEKIARRVLAQAA